MAKVKLNTERAAADKTYVKKAITPPVSQSKTSKESWDTYKDALKSNDMLIKDPSGNIVKNPNYKETKLTSEEKKKIANFKIEY